MNAIHVSWDREHDLNGYLAGSTCPSMASRALSYTDSLARNGKPATDRENADLENTTGLNRFPQLEAFSNLCRQPRRSHRFEEPGRWYGVGDLQTGAERKKSLYYPGDIMSEQPSLTRTPVPTDALPLPCPAAYRSEGFHSYHRAIDLCE